MEEVKSDTYLGDVLSSDGNIDARFSKGLGVVSQIMDLHRNLSFGSHYFEIAKTLREAMLVNGLLTNSEVCMLFLSHLQFFQSNFFSLLFH